MFDFHKNYFELYGLQKTWTVDLDLLHQRYKQALLKTHPDRFAAAATDYERRLAVQYTALLNEAYAVLRSPIKRAIYLLKTLGVEVNFEMTTAMPVDFLLAQIKLREELESAADDEKKLLILKETVTNNFEKELAVLSQFFADASEQSLSAAKETIAKLMFYEKLLAELKEKQ